MAGTSRRKSSRREPTSDIDEDPAPRRNRREEVDTDEEEQSQRARAKEKRSKGKARAQEPEPERQDVNMNQEESDDDVQIDVENFPDQALQQDGYRKLDGLASDWKTMADTIKNSSHAIENIAMGLAEASEGESVQKNLVKLEQLLKQLIDVESEMMRNEATLNGYAQEMRSGDEVVNVVKRYLGDVQANKVAYQKLTTRQKYAKNENYKSLKENLYAIDHPGEAMPPITEFCPLTLRQLENPVTSKVCGHSFSREALKQLFANHRGAKMCPASGCNRSFTYNDCKPDNKLAQRMRIYIRRQQSASQNANDEIVE
ncbi:hypothetical protein WG66_005004 [Moniliophthora roreri]|nr:hypothetical protein WG66_005004 [Moniliophthora roreri]